MTNRVAFTTTNLYQAPELHGVYTLYDYTGVIYYGKAEGINVSIRSRLRDHLSGKEGRCTQVATGFAWEVTNFPTYRERQLLQEFLLLYGRLPKCNDVMPR